MLGGDHWSCASVAQWTMASAIVLGVGENPVCKNNHAGSGKGPLCSGASQFAVGYAAGRL